MASNYAGYDQGGVNQRFKIALDAVKSSSYRKLAADLGLDAAYLIKIANGQRAVPAELAVAFCRTYSLNVAWMLWGDGQMTSPDNLVNESQSNNPDLSTYSVNQSVNLNRNYVEKGEGINQIVSDVDAPYKKREPIHVVTVNAKDEPVIVLVPVRAQAGYTSSQYFETEDFRNLPTVSVPGLSTGKEYRAFEVQGDSMEQTLYNGDIMLCSRVLVDRAHTLRPGEAYVFVTCDDVLVKRMAPNGGSEALTVYSDNPNYPPFDIPKPDLREIWHVDARLTMRIGTPNRQLEAQLAASFSSLEARLKPFLSQ